MAPPNPYRTAPTFLTNLDGESKLFQTQEEVDQAWKDGWFGPPWLAKKTPLLSERIGEIVDGKPSGDLDVKRKMEDAMDDDPRYRGLKTHRCESWVKTMAKIKKFEKEHDLERVVVESGE